MNGMANRMGRTPRMKWRKQSSPTPRRWKASEEISSRWVPGVLSSHRHDFAGTTCLTTADLSFCRSGKLVDCPFRFILEVGGPSFKCINWEVCYIVSCNGCSVCIAMTFRYIHQCLYNNFPPDKYIRVCIAISSRYIHLKKFPSMK
jgi:hypothetical protein